MQGASLVFTARSKSHQEIESAGKDLHHVLDVGVLENFTGFACKMFEDQTFCGNKIWFFCKNTVPLHYRLQTQIENPIYNAAFDNRRQLKAVNDCHSELCLWCLWALRSLSGYCSIVVFVSEQMLGTCEWVLGF